MIDNVINYSEKIVKKILDIVQFIKDPYYPKQVPPKKFLKKALKVSIPIFLILLIFNILATCDIFNIRLIQKLLFWLIDAVILLFILTILFENGKKKANFSFNLNPEIAKLLYADLKINPDLEIINEQTTIDDFINVLCKYRYNHNSHIILNLKIYHLKSIIDGLRILSTNNFTDTKFFKLKLFYQYYQGDNILYKNNSYKSIISKKGKNNDVQKDETFNKTIIEIFKKFKETNLSKEF